MVGINPDFKIDYEKGGFSFYKQLINEMDTRDIAIEKAIKLGNNLNSTVLLNNQEEQLKENVIKNYLQ